MAKGSKASAGKRKWDELREAALAFPGAWEDFPWGEVVAKVGKKVFVFLGHPESESVTVTVKLVASHQHAVSVDGAAPASHGLGKSGWVTVPIAGVETDLLEEWLEESYRNVAPKKLAAQLDG